MSSSRNRVSCGDSAPPIYEFERRPQLPHASRARIAICNRACSRDGDFCRVHQRIDADYRVLPGESSAEVVGSPRRRRACHSAGDLLLVVVDRIGTNLDPGGRMVARAAQLRR